MVLSCIDPRFQPIIFNYLTKKKLKGKYSLFTVAGASIGVTAPKFKKWHTTALLSNARLGWKYDSWKTVNR